MGERSVAYPRVDKVPRSAAQMTDVMTTRVEFTVAEMGAACAAVIPMSEIVRCSILDRRCLRVFLRGGHASKSVLLGTFVLAARVYGVRPSQVLATVPCHRWR